jgi:hypothetical protein
MTVVTRAATTDDLPDPAARWLAAGLVDNESFRLLAGHDPHDPAMLDMLIADSVSEADVTIPSESTRLQEIAIDWVTSTWRHTGDTRWAISTLAQRGETYPEFGLRPSSERSETRVPEPPAFPAREPNGSKRWSAARERSTARSPSWIRRWQCRVGGPNFQCHSRRWPPRGRRSPFQAAGLSRMSATARMISRFTAISPSRSCHAWLASSGRGASGGHSSTGGALFRIDALAE